MSGGRSERAVAEQVERDDAVAALGERASRAGSCMRWVSSRPCSSTVDARALAVARVGEPVAVELEGRRAGGIVAPVHGGRCVWSPVVPTRIRPMRRGGRARRPRRRRSPRSATSTRASGTRYAGAAAAAGATRVRLRRLLETDPGGAWVAERDGARGRLRRWRSCARACGACRCSSSHPDGAVARASAARCSRAPARYGDGRARPRSSSPRATRGRCAPTRGSGSTLHPALRRAPARRAASSAPADVRAGRRRATCRSPRRSTAPSAAPPTARTSRRCSRAARALLVAARARLRAAPGGARAAAGRARRRGGARRCCAARLARAGRARRVTSSGSPARQQWAVGRVRRRRARAAPRRRRRVHRRRRRAVRALPPQRRVPVSADRSLTQRRFLRRN